MSKKAVILHGTDGAPAYNWFPWLKAELEKKGYEVWVPELPNNHTPNRYIYNDFLFSSGHDFTDNLVIGHSSGAVSILNLLADKRCPRIKAAVLVGAWSHLEDEAEVDEKRRKNLLAAELDREQFKDLFPEDGFDFTTINSKADNFLFIHGDNDPYCPLEQAKWLAKQTGGSLVIVPGGGHLSQGFGFTELPQLIDTLEEHQFL